MVSKPLHIFQTTPKHTANCMQGCVFQGGEGRDAEGLLLPLPFLWHQSCRRGKQQIMTYIMAAPCSGVCPQSIVQIFSTDYPHYSLQAHTFLF